VGAFDKREAVRFAWMSGRAFFHRAAEEEEEEEGVEELERDFEDEEEVELDGFDFFAGGGEAVAAEEAREVEATG